MYLHVSICKYDDSVNTTILVYPSDVYVYHMILGVKYHPSKCLSIV